jgi:Putative auto-transporter adhesin, head GIN domain
MKQKFILSIMAIAFSVLSVTAQSQEALVVNAGNTENITIATDMNVVLMPASEADRSISMDAKAAEKLNLRIANNSMTISPVKQSMSKDKFTVHIYVNNLKTLTVEDNSNVKTIGVLDTPKLDVFVDGKAVAHLKTNGDIKAYPLNGGGEVKVKYLSDWLARR